jgi:hypothetical protein
MEWIDVQVELPPKDGLYEISNDKNSRSAQGCYHYDGIGFFIVNAYRPVKFWRHHMSLSNKKYGKVLKEKKNGIKT